MSNIEGQPDHAAPAVKTEGVSPKAIAAGVVGALVGVIVTVLNAMQAQPDLLGSLPTFWQSAILLVIPPVVSFLAAYQASPGTVSMGSR
jgi:uncharacterized RDD family membrane protein YckC